MISKREARRILEAETSENWQIPDIALQAFQDCIRDYAVHLAKATETAQIRTNSILMDSGLRSKKRLLPSNIKAAHDEFIGGL